ncbi:hypothetical protein JOL62DRAFT_95086 [Phyllosticta paracitricarpa]|uniref:Secreted protein n=1 Tax=Phyllosticta paracitricarpa TaxID=2016321 RepID=A0ABR1N9V9_9PEZI
MLHRILTLSLLFSSPSFCNCSTSHPPASLSSSLTSLFTHLPASLSSFQAVTFRLLFLAHFFWLPANYSRSLLPGLSLPHFFSYFWAAAAAPLSAYLPHAARPAGRTDEEDGLTDRRTCQTHA